MASNYLRAYPSRRYWRSQFGHGQRAVRIRCLPHYATRICFTESYGVKQSRRGERQVAYKVNGSASRQAGNFSR
ncbi:hypothetical protein CE493_21910 [Salmonella enterica subsp. enterica serovar Heidelberg]|nr:hypothetical protein CE493_21910 [Salmonella enterica subsp. enterica serovar Heidelberg]